MVQSEAPVRLQSGSATTATEMDGMSPREVSYWLALIFAQSPMLQQALLEVTNTVTLCMHLGHTKLRPHSTGLSLDICSAGAKCQEEVGTRERGSRRHC